MNILVTGGAGFIGSHIVDHLLADGHQVTVIDNLSSGSRANLPQEVAFHPIDIRSPRVQQLWCKEGFEVMIHMAAQINVRASVEDPANDADVNLAGLLNLMEAGRRHGLKHVVFASSGGAAYGNDVPYPTPESHPASPLSPYGVAKIASELYLDYYAAQDGISSTVMRIANAYGPRQNPHGEAGVVAIFSTLLLDGGTPVINGTGQQTRDYIYCEDIARFAALAVRSRVAGRFNLSTGRETSVTELLGHIQASLASTVPARHGPAKASEVRRFCRINS